MRPKNVPNGGLVVSPLNVREEVGDIGPLAESIKREALAPIPTHVILSTIPIRVEPFLFEPLRQSALDNNLGDRVSVAAKNLISEGLSSKGYLRGRSEEPDVASRVP